MIKLWIAYLAFGSVLSTNFSTNITPNNFSDENLITSSNISSTDTSFNSTIFIRTFLYETKNLSTDRLTDESFFSSMNISNNSQTGPVQNSSFTDFKNQTLFSLTFPDTSQYVSASLETLKDFSYFSTTEIANTSQKQKLDFSTSVFGQISQSSIQVNPELQIEIYGLIILSRFSLLKRLFAGSANISSLKDLVVSIIGADSTIEIETIGRSKYSLILFYSSNSNSTDNVSLDEEIKGIVQILFDKQSQLEREAVKLAFSLLIDVNEMEIKAYQNLDINGIIIKFECLKERDQSWMTCQNNGSKSDNSSWVDLSPISSTKPTNLAHKIYIPNFFLFLFCYWL
ncbi:hypothetical protein BpHYR1_034666 [Brachionus plicatilis]|uniref:Uncharacterized protein n=1 Tax=Brachionus plicatilis TaxID=10195 RepID=A0A3M7S245_BRAPC|nr:hypothetical protein BpHYR1_034666 [Brachionus plicatilis]